MDARGNIYEGTEDDPVTPEDKARLDGYLKARAEADLAAHMERLAALEAEDYEVVPE